MTRDELIKLKEELLSKKYTLLKINNDCIEEFDSELMTESEIKENDATDDFIKTIENIFEKIVRNNSIEGVEIDRIFADIDAYVFCDNHFTKYIIEHQHDNLADFIKDYDLDRFLKNYSCVNINNIDYNTYDKNITYYDPNINIENYIINFENLSKRIHELGYEFYIWNTFLGKVDPCLIARQVLYNTNTVGKISVDLDKKPKSKVK